MVYLPPRVHLQRLVLRGFKLFIFFCFICNDGNLLQSVSSERKMNALAASFVSSPVGENVDWKLSATISPCHVTVCSCLNKWCSTAAFPCS